MAQLPYELGELDMQSDIMGQLINNPQFAELFAASQGGRDRRVEKQIGNLTDLQKMMLEGGFFGEEEEGTFRDLISGKTLKGQGGALYDMIQESFGKTRGQSRDYASSMGLAPTSGEAMSMTGNVLGNQDRAFAEQMVNKYLDMVGAGTTGLSTMGNEQLSRQQSSGNIGSWLANFIEGSDQNRLQIGADITSRQNQPMLDILGMSQNQRFNRKPPAWQTALEVGAQALPFFLGSSTGGGGGGTTPKPSGWAGGSYQA